MTRAVIYARFSSDLQSDRSIEDQEALCRDICARAGYQVTATYSDRALSGTSTARRAGYQAMMRAAALRSFDVIVAEDIDRMFRNEADFHDARQRLTFLGISIHTAQGIVSRIEGSLRAMMSALYIENLALHVHRGLAGVIRDGRHAGGNPYGYRPIKGEPGRLSIVEAEAAVIRRIFERYAAGALPRQIAANLNADGIAPPRGLTYWRASTINGDGPRQSGILRNEIYVGRIVWNKTHKVRDPDTGRRLTRSNPPDKWQRADAPELRIIGDDLFAAANALRKARSGAPRQMRRAPARMLSGLLRCAACGGGMSIKDYDRGRPRIICTNSKESGSCANGRAYALPPIEREVVAALRGHLGNRTAIAHFIRCYNDERRKAAGDAIRRHDEMQSRLAAVEREIARTVTAVVKGIVTEAEAGQHLPQLRGERQGLIETLARVGEPAKVVAMHPAAVERYLRDIQAIEEAINRDIAAGNNDVAHAIRRMVSTVTVHPAAAGEAPMLTVTGHLASLVAEGEAGPPVFSFEIRRAASGGS